MHVKQKRCQGNRIKNNYNNHYKNVFFKVPDRRDNRGLKHKLANIIVMSIYAVLCGYIDAENMAFFMKLQETYFTKILDLKHRVPSADTLLRVFALIDSESLMK